MIQAATGNEVDDVIRDLKKITGFTAYLILNNDGKKQNNFPVLTQSLHN
jgi:hypothetical protein